MFIVIELVPLPVAMLKPVPVYDHVYDVALAIAPTEYPTPFCPCVTVDVPLIVPAADGSWFTFTDAVATAVHPNALDAVTV